MTAPALPEVALVLPAYNEEKDLPVLLTRIGEAMQRQALSYQIIVVDDGSKDRTAHIATEAARTMPLKLIQHEVNRGLGGAMQTGLAAAMDAAKFVVTMDSDNSHDPVYIADMVKFLDGHPAVDYVIVSRYQPGSVVVGVPYYRQLLSYGCFFLLKVLAPYKSVRDYSTGFRGYRAEVLTAAAKSYDNKLIEESGFVCQLELLLKLRAIGAVAAEIPYVLRYDLKEGVSKLRIWRTLQRYLAVIAKHRSRRPDALRKSTADSHTGKAPAQAAGV